MQLARIIPVSGIANEREAEQRATSAVLAVFSIVRPLSIEIFSPLGASRAQRATVEAFTEVIFSVDKRKIRPDGLIRVSHGKRVWTCLVEVKTGESAHSAEQVNEYWDLARAEGFDHVLTISNRLPSNPNEHPVQGLKVRSNSRVQVSHLSWTRLLTTAVRLKQSATVTDPEQAWILNELIRYLEHPASGALAFSDMGPHWVAVRDAARFGTLDRRVDGLDDVLSRWDQLLRYTALKLGAEVGQDVMQVLPRTLQSHRVRLQQLRDQIVSRGELDGVLRIPSTAGDLSIVVDLRGQHLVLSMDVSAPVDRGARARAAWIVNQLKEAPPSLVIESYARGARQCESTTLAQAREDRLSILGGAGRDPVRFRLLVRLPMGQGRRKGTRSPGFIESVVEAVGYFYGNVVQNVARWQAPAPRIKRLEIAHDQSVAESDPEGMVKTSVEPDAVVTPPSVSKALEPVHRPEPARSTPAELPVSQPVSVSDGAANQS